MEISFDKKMKLYMFKVNIINYVEYNNSILSNADDIPAC